MEEDTIFIEKVKQIIQTDMNNSFLNGAFIAEKFGISRMQLHRKLKTIMNQSATDFINHIRIEYAKEQLINTSKYTYIIAQECGFEHTTYFSKLFKKATGFSPIEYRKKLGDE